MSIKERTRLIFIEAGRVFDFTGSYNSTLREKYLNTSSYELDTDSMRSIWNNVGESIRHAMEHINDDRQQLR